MPRFFIVGSNISGNTVRIAGADADHIRVLRMRVGDDIIICDGNGTDRLCRLTSLSSAYIEAEVYETFVNPAEPSVSVTIIAGLPKGERSDYIVQKCTEGGASKIVFFISERCVAKFDAKSAEKKCFRWQRIAEEAAKQSGRGIIPEIMVLGSLSEAIDMAAKAELPLLMYETGDRIALKNILESSRPFSTTAIITGPEGGFEKFEVELALEAGIPACSMGPRILRCETAPLCALTAIMYATCNL